MGGEMMGVDSVLKAYKELPKWCGVKDTAAFLGVSTRTVYQMLSDGSIKGAWRRVDSGRWRIPKESLAVLIGLRVDDAGGVA